jgi:hypothetical protein
MGDYQVISRIFIRNLRGSTPVKESYRSLRKRLAPDINSNSRVWRKIRALIESKLGREYTRVGSSLVRKGYKLDS